MFANEFCIPGMRVLNVGTENYNPIFEFITSEQVINIGNVRSKFTDLVFMDPDSVPLEENSFDIILDLESIPISSSELRRILKPNGVILSNRVIDGNVHFKSYQVYGKIVYVY
jgi:SAM-dependent methyltransferase